MAITTRTAPKAQKKKAKKLPAFLQKVQEPEEKQPAVKGKATKKVPQSVVAPKKAADRKTRNKGRS